MAEPIYNGKPNFEVGMTPYGFYDAELSGSGGDKGEADKFAEWAARRLGYPIMSIEIQSGSFYACLEEAISEYSSHVNSFNIRDNLLHLQGQPTGSSLDRKLITPTFNRAIQLSEQYGTEAGVGGRVDWKKGSININSGSQTYDLDSLYAEVSESGKAIEIRKVYYEASPAVTRYFDPYAGTGAGSYNMMDSFGWGNMTPAVQFMMMPIYADLLRIQAIEFNDEIRKSAYSFNLVNNKLRIFPKPNGNYKLYFDYIIKEERANPLISGSEDVVSDFSNAPYTNIKFSYINDVGKQWIRKYGLSLSKELLGIIRSKYGSIPIPGSETTLDGDTLRTEAATEKEYLISELRETLEAMSRKTLMEAEQEEAEHLQNKLNKSPLKIYIG